jgi:hypothetical protein
VSIVDVPPREGVSELATLLMSTFAHGNDGMDVEIDMEKSMFGGAITTPSNQ